MKHKLKIKESVNATASHAQLTDASGGPNALSTTLRRIMPRYWEGNPRPIKNNVRRKVPVACLLVIPNNVTIEVVVTRRNGNLFPHKAPVLTAKVTGNVLSASIREASVRKKDNDNKPTRARLRKISTADGSPIILWVRDRLRLVLKKA